MSGLRDAVLRAQQRGPAVPQQSIVVDANPNAWQAIVAAGTLNNGSGQLTNFQQLTTLRRKFDASIKRTTRFEDGLDVSRWGVVSGRVRRQQTTAHGQRNSSQRGRGTAQQEAWPADLEADLEAVALEAGLVTPAVRAVLRAAQRGTISSNPGLLLCQLLRFQACLGGLLGGRQVMAALRSHPALLNSSPDELAWHLEELQEIFGAPTAAAMVAKQPMLLCACPFTVWSNLEALRSMLCTRLDRARHIAARQPRLLLNSPSALRSRLSDLEDLTQLPTNTLQVLISSQPALLTYHPATLAENLERMAHLLGMTSAEAGRLICKAPALLMLHHETLSSKLQGLAQVLQCDMAQATALVHRQPSLLSMSTQLIADKCQRLPALLDTAQQDVALVVAAQPSLLTISSATLQRKLQALEDAVSSISGAQVIAQHGHSQRGAQHTGQMQAVQDPEHKSGGGYCQLEQTQGSSVARQQKCCSAGASGEFIGNASSGTGPKADCNCAAAGLEQASAQQGAGKEGMHHFVLLPPALQGSLQQDAVDRTLGSETLQATAWAQDVCACQGVLGGRNTAAPALPHIGSQAAWRVGTTPQIEREPGGGVGPSEVCAALLQPAATGVETGQPASAPQGHCGVGLVPVQQYAYVTGSLAASMGQAWQQQLRDSKPHVRATYACFSEKRYARLQQLVSVVTATTAGCPRQYDHKTAAYVQQAVGKQWALSRLLRVSDVKFADLLTSAVGLVQGAAH